MHSVVSVGNRKKGMFVSVSQVDCRSATGTDVAISADQCPPSLWGVKLKRQGRARAEAKGTRDTHADDATVRWRP